MIINSTLSNLVRQILYRVSSSLLPLLSVVDLLEVSHDHLENLFLVLKALIVRFSTLGASTL